MKRVILMTGGGTAGHVMPNIALMPSLREKGYELHYAGTATGIERTLIEKEKDVVYHVVSSGKLRRYFSLKNFTDPFRVVKGIFDARAIVKKIKPDVVFSKGGFVTVPVVLGAKGKAKVIIHESDYTPGLANRIAMKAADKVLYTFEDGAANAKKDGKKHICTGLPLRQELFQGDAKKGLELAGFNGKKPVLLIMGGSLGAKAVNDAVQECLCELLERFDVVHLCGKGKVNSACMKTGYKAFEYLGETFKDVLAASSVVVSRAGANSIFELLAVKKPMLLIPLPKSQSRGDQLVNAAYVARKGYAKVLQQEELTAESLVRAVNELYDTRETYIKAMAKANGAEGVNNVIRQIELTVNESRKA